MNQFICFLVLLPTLLFGSLAFGYGDERASEFVRVRGTFRAQNTDKQALDLRLKVWDTQRGQYLRQVWQPHPETGEYFMLLSPGIRYTFYIHPRGFMPYKFTVNLPQRLFSYTLSQTIEFQELRLREAPIGQKAVVLEHDEHYTYLEHIGDSAALLKRQQAFLSDLIERAMTSSNPYSMDRLGYWMGSDALTDSDEEQPEAPYEEYDDMVNYIDDAINSANGTLSDKPWPERESELPPAQYAYFQEAASARAAGQAHGYSTLHIPLLFPEGKNSPGRAQRQLLRRVAHRLAAHGHDLLPILTVPDMKAANLVRVRRIQRPFETLPVQEEAHPDLPAIDFPFAKNWCVYYLRISPQNH